MEALINSLLSDICQLGRRDTQGAANLTLRAMSFAHELADSAESTSEAAAGRAMARVAGPACQRLVAACRTQIVPQLLSSTESAVKVAGAQLHATIVLVNACCKLHRASCPDADAATLKALYTCVGLLLGPGRAVLAGCDGPRHRVTGAGAEFAEWALGSQAEFMLTLFQSAGMELGDVGEFVTQLAPPGAVLAWMGAAARAALALYGTSLGRGRSAKLLQDMTQTLIIMCTLPPFWGHAEALGADTALQRSLVQLLAPGLRAAAVAAQLPPDRRPEGWGWGEVQALASVLSNASMADGVVECLHPAANGCLGSGAWQLLQSLAQLVVCAPHDPLDGGSLPAHAAVWFRLGHLLGAVCSHSDDAAIARQPQATALLQQAVLRMPRSLQLVAAEAARQAAEDAATAGGAADATARLCQDWMYVVVTLVPHAALQVPLQPMGLSLAEVPAWCAVTGAMLRTLPQVAAIHDLMLQLPDGDVDEEWEAAPAELANFLLEAASGIANSCRESVLAGRPAGMAAAGGYAAAAQAAATAVWQLHTACCRTEHWLAPRRGGVLPGSAGEAPGRRQLLAVLVDSYSAAVDLGGYLAELQQEGSGHAHEEMGGLLAGPLAGQVRAMSAGHLEALASLLKHEEFEPEALAGDTALEATQDTARSLLLAAKLCDPEGAALTAPLQTGLGTLWAHILDRGDEDEGFEAQLFSTVLLCTAAPMPRLMAWLVANGVLDAAIDCMATLATARSSVGGVLAQQVAQPLGTGTLAIVGALQTLGLRVRHMPRAVGRTFKPQALALSAAVASVQHFGQQNADTFVHLQRDALPPARELAAALLAQELTEEQVAAGRLAAAQAAAGRSCAYLRCPNVRVLEEGGPAAGQGNGTQRCGGCRAVRYCNTACSHADWRAGHKRVCAALAAQQQQPQQSGSGSSSE